MRTASSRTDSVYSVCCAASGERRAQRRSAKRCHQTRVFKGGLLIQCAGDCLAQRPLPLPRPAAGARSTLSSRPFPRPEIRLRRHLLLLLRLERWRGCRACRPSHGSRFRGRVSPTYRARSSRPADTSPTSTLTRVLASKTAAAKCSSPAAGMQTMRATRFYTLRLQNDAPKWVRRRNPTSVVYPS
jgi:hypothetical protein